MFVLALIISVIVPLIVVLCGYLMKYHTLKEITELIGYRTKRSMSSQEAWCFANELCGELFLKGGLISILPSLALSLAGCFLFGNSNGVLISTVIECIQVALIFSPVYYIEKQLKLKFEKDDNNKEQI